MGMEKNTAGHRLKINRDFVGYFDAARQQGEPEAALLRCTAAAAPPVGRGAKRRQSAAGLCHAAPAWL